AVAIEQFLEPPVQIQAGFPELLTIRGPEERSFQEGLDLPARPSRESGRFSLQRPISRCTDSARKGRSRSPSWVLSPWVFSVSLLLSSSNWSRVGAVLSTPRSGCSSRSSRTCAVLAAS